MKHEERARLLEVWTERLSELVYRDMWEGLTEKLAPMKHVNGKRVSPDKYASAVRSIYEDLESVLERLTKLNEQAQEESNQTIDAYGMFYAWELGLCPLALKAHSEINGYMYYGLVLEEIAKHRNVENMSYEDTERAIEIWYSEKRRLA